MLMILTILVGAATAQTSGQPAPLTDPASWVAPQDYPPAALRGGAQGVVRFELGIDAQGRVTDCRIVLSSGSSDLDRATCSLAHRRARFAPGRDSAGNAAAGTFASQVRWTLPPRPPKPVTGWLSAATMRLAADATMTACDVEKRGPVPERVSDPCGAFGVGKRHPMLASIGGGAGKPQTLVSEMAMAFDGAPALPMRYLAPGHRLAVRTQVRFDVTETGKVENCVRVPTGQEGFLAQLPSACGFDIGPFVPVMGAAGVPRRVQGTYTVAISAVE